MFYAVPSQDDDGLGPDTAFVVGRYICDSGAAGVHGPGRLVVVISTRNLIGNGYRACVRGCGEVQLQLDTTYRLVIEGHGTMVMGVTSLDQKFHLLAYAVVNKEDTEGHA